MEPYYLETRCGRELWSVVDKADPHLVERWENEPYGVARGGRVGGVGGKRVIYTLPI